jgi:hypothetical protein
MALLATLRFRLFITLAMRAISLRDEIYLRIAARKGIHSSSSTNRTAYLPSTIYAECPRRVRSSRADYPRGHTHFSARFLHGHSRCSGRRKSPLTSRTSRRLHLPARSGNLRRILLLPPRKTSAEHLEDGRFHPDSHATAAPRPQRLRPPLRRRLRNASIIPHGLNRPTQSSSSSLAVLSQRALSNPRLTYWQPVLDFISRHAALHANASSLHSQAPSS